jgi:5-(carboxyamino)imidazole ribonucleotide synthase
MLGIAARQMGYRFHVFTPEPGSPAGQIADREVVAEYDDLDAVRTFARGVDVVTFEFENVPAATADACREHSLVRPDGSVLHTAQDRLREKRFLQEHGFPTTEWWAVTDGAADRGAAEEESSAGYPAVLKTAGFGYDGKGQVVVRSAAEAGAAWERLGRVPCILERFVDYRAEVSVVAARGTDGAFAHFGVVQNEHSNHILDVTTAPAPCLSPTLRTEAVQIAEGVLEALGVVGVLCVELFVTSSDRLLVNELAPRPHNSGHFTIDACVTSQFEQQLRAVCGVALGDASLREPAAAMANLLGDLWDEGDPDWAGMLGAYPDVKLHLYGKAAARPGRKMGHLTVTSSTPGAAAERIRRARATLAPA